MLGKEREFLLKFVYYTIASIRADGSGRLTRIYPYWTRPPDMRDAHVQL